MKIITNQIFMFLAFITFLLLILIIESTKKSSRNSKKNIEAKSSANLKIVKRHCTACCNKEKKDYFYEMIQSLFARLRNINTEYYI